MIKKVGLIIIVIATIFNLILPMQKVYAADPKKENVNEVMGGISEDSADSLINDGKTTANPEGGSSKHKVSTLRPDTLDAFSNTSRLTGNFS